MKKLLWALTGLIAVGTLAWMAQRNAEWNEALALMQRLDWRVLVLAVGAALAARLMDAIRWKLLLPKEHVSTARLFLVRNTGQGVNVLSPLKALSEITGTVMLRFGNDIRADKVVSSLLLTRLLDMLFTVSLVGVGLIILPQLAGFRPVVASLWAVIFAVFVAIVLLSKWIQRVPRIMRIAGLSQLIQSMHLASSRGRIMLACVALTATAWMSIGVAAWLVAQAAGIDMPLWLVSIVIIAVTVLTSLTPAATGAVGIYEFVTISTLGLFAIDPTVALTFALVIHAVLFLPPLLIGTAVLSVERRTLGRVWATLTSAVSSKRPENTI
jgi:uncharacterized protein (TIRG00374 family)